jgi:hypothetical protein
MKTLFKLTRMALVIVAAFYLYGIGRKEWATRDRHVTLANPLIGPLTDAMAVSISRQALEQAGEDSRYYAPETYDGRHYYVRNPSGRYNGQVEWRGYGDHPDFTVQLDQEGSEVVVCISKRR